MTTFTRTQILDTLTQGIANVTFRKVSDGTLRTMRCTLREDAIPAKAAASDRAPRAIDENTLAVYNTELSAWRSFRIDAVQAVEPV